MTYPSLNLAAHLEQTGSSLTHLGPLSEFLYQEVDLSEMMQYLSSSSLGLLLLMEYLQTSEIFRKYGKKCLYLYQMVTAIKLQPVKLALSPHSSNMK